MKIFPLIIASVSLFSLAPAYASGCYMVTPTGQKIEMDFCGVNNSSEPAPVRQQSVETEPSELTEAEPVSTGLSGGNVTREKWSELKTFVAQQKDGIPVTLGDVRSILGFNGDLTKTQADGSQQWEWKSDRNPNIKIVGIFVSDELKSLKGTVY